MNTMPGLSLHNSFHVSTKERHKKLTWENCTHVEPPEDVSFIMECQGALLGDASSETMEIIIGKEN